MRNREEKLIPMTLNIKPKTRLKIEEIAEEEDRSYAHTARLCMERYFKILEDLEGETE